MTNAGGHHLNENFACLWCCYVYFLDYERMTRFNRHCSSCFHEAPFISRLDLVKSEPNIKRSR